MKKTFSYKLYFQYFNRTMCLVIVCKQGNEMFPSENRHNTIIMMTMFKKVTQS